MNQYSFIDLTVLNENQLSIILFHENILYLLIASLTSNQCFML